MADVKIGDTVKLKSGGPLMTVNEFTTAHIHSSSDSPKDHVLCQWFDESHICKTGRFAVAALELN